MSKSKPAADESSAGDVIFAGGSKGGTGKSSTARGAIDFLSCLGVDPQVIDTDTENPDVAKVYPEISAAIRLADKNDLIAIIEQIEKVALASPIVVNLMAGANGPMIECASSMSAGLSLLQEETSRRIRVLWVINTDRDCVESLRQFLAAYPDLAVDVIRNLFYGRADQFELFDQSKTRKEVEARGGKVVDFPRLADRCANYMNNSRIKIADAATSREVSIGIRAEVQAWRKQVAAMFEALGIR